MLLVALFCLLNGLVNCSIDTEKRPSLLEGPKSVDATTDYLSYFILRATLGDYYSTLQFITVGDNAVFNLIPDSMSLDTALNGFQCQTPSCRAACQGFGFRESLSSNFTTNGTLFRLNQTYNVYEGVRSQDTFGFRGPSGLVVSNISNVTFMNSFYALPKEPISTNIVDGFCGAGNGTLGIGRGLEGVMGDTIMSRFIEDSNADLLGAAYASFYDYIYGAVAMLSSIVYPPSLAKDYQNLISEWPLWTLPITNLSFNNSPFGANGIGVIDTASLFLRMPTIYADLIAQMAMATSEETPYGKQYTIQVCNPATLPNITIRIANDTYNITGRAYAKPLDPLNIGGECLVLIMGTDSTYDDTPIWRLGYPFLATVETYLNFTSNNITLVNYYG